MKKNKLLSLFQILSVGLLAATLVFSQAKPDAEMILVRASVVDSKGNAVENLKQEQFIVKEEGVEQEIKYFSDRKEPASVLILLDISGSSEQSLREIHAAYALNFIQNNAENDYSIVAFNNKITELADWGSSREQMTDAVNKTAASKKIRGNTAFYDALSYSLDKFKNSKYEKKVLLIFSDGQENASKKNFPELAKELKKSDVSVFSIVIIAAEKIDNPLGPTVLDFAEINKISGGQAYYVYTKAEIESALKRIGLVLNNQYVIGYIPKQSPQSSKEKSWRKIEVRVSAAGEKRKNLKADVLARGGYSVEK